MKRLMTFYYYYLLVIRRVYVKRWRGFNTSSNTLAFSCILCIIMFFSSMLPQNLGYKSIFVLGIPLAPIASILYLIIHFSAITIYRETGNCITRSEIRELTHCSYRVGIHTIYAYITMCFVLFVTSIVLLDPY